jgi:hypothetical protein
MRLIKNERTIKVCEKRTTRSMPLPAFGHAFIVVDFVCLKREQDRLMNV